MKSSEVQASQISLKHATDGMNGTKKKLCTIRRTQINMKYMLFLKCKLLFNVPPVWHLENRFKNRHSLYNF